MIRTEYEAILKRFQEFLVQFGNKRTIHADCEQSSDYQCVCQTLHEDMDALLKLCKFDTLGADLEWKERFKVV